MQEGSGGGATSIGWFASLQPGGVNHLSMSWRARLGADDVGLDHLLEGRPLQTTGQITSDVLHCQVEVIRVD